jgi:hypothetical protein
LGLALEKGAPCLQGASVVQCFIILATNMKTMF